VLAPAVLAVALAGCGGGGARTAAANLGASRTAPRAADTGTVRAPYRWLVRTSGPAPSIRAENAAQGTVAWRLPGPPALLGGEAHGAIAGYVSSEAISRGQTETVYVNAPGARGVRVDVYRMGWYGGLGGHAVLASGALHGIHQPPCTHSAATGLTECDWRPTLSFAIPPALPSGVYVAMLTASTGAQSDCVFVLRAAHVPRVLVQLPTATWEAYNAWGGDSLYPGGRLPVGVTHSSRGVSVSYDRPYETQTGAGQFFAREVALVRFLERYGYPVGYTTDASIDADPGQVRGARVLIDAGHSEYWSTRQARAFSRASAAGTSVMFLSSDTLAWRIRYAPAGPSSSDPGAPGGTIVAYKEAAALDPHRLAPSGLFPYGGAQLAGSSYDGCITPRLPGGGPPRYRYYGWRFRPRAGPAWLFARSGITARTVIPGIAGYELDELTPQAPAGTRVVGESVGVRCMGEQEPAWVRGSGGQSTLRVKRSGAFVFAAGTLGWLYALSPVPQASPDVPRAPVQAIVTLTRNLIAHGLAPR
jgi:hypothetical protein